MVGGRVSAHVVVIDDAPDLLDFYGDVLSEDGCRVTPLSRPAGDPSEVLRLDPDLIVLDLIYQGEASGLPFLRRLRAVPHGEAIPVVICTAAVGMGREAEDELRRLGAAFLAKPFDLDDLLAHAHAAHRTSRDRPSAALDKQLGGDG